MICYYDQQVPFGIRSFTLNEFQKQFVSDTELTLGGNQLRLLNQQSWLVRTMVAPLLLVKVIKRS